jgi:hypothetical protein
VILLAEDVEASGFPIPIKAGGVDRIVVRGKVMMVQSVDDSTRRVADTLIAYELRVTGG